MTRLRRFVDDTLGGPARASDELAGAVAVLHTVVVVGVLSLSWFDGSDQRLLVAARPGPQAALEDGAGAGPSALAWLLTLVGSFPWWAAVALLAVLTLLADLALWLLLRTLLGRRLRVPVALAAVVGLPLVTAAATDLSVGSSALPALALTALAVALAARDTALTSVAAALAGVAAVAFHPGAGIVLLVLLLVATGPRRLAALPPVAATVAWLAIVPAVSRPVALGGVRDVASALLGWPPRWETTGRGVGPDLPVEVAWVLAGVAALGAVLLLHRRPRALVAVLVGVLAGACLAQRGVGPGPLAPAAAAIATGLALALRSASVPQHRVRRAGLVGLAGVLVASGTVSAAMLGAALARQDPAGEYARTVEATARRTGTVRLAATDVPRQVVAPDALGTARGPLAVADLFERSRGVRVERSGNDLRVADPLGFLKVPAVEGGVRTPQPSPGTCGTVVRSTRPVPVAALAERGPRRGDWLAIGYLASADDRATLELDGVRRPVRLLRGSHTWFLHLSGRTVQDVRLAVGTRGTTVCVGSVQRGPLIASEFS